MRNVGFISRTVCFISLSIIFVACESDQAKLQRLETEQAMACLLAQADQKEYETARYPGGMTAQNISAPPSHKADSLGKTWYDHKAKCELATREYNRFMR